MKKKAILMTAILTLSVGNMASAFSDVSSGKWYHSEIMKLKSKGIVNGYQDGTFRPYNNVSNAEALAMVLRSVGLESSNSNQGNWADGIVALGSQLGIINSNNFQRDANANREQVAEMIVKALKIEDMGTSQSIFSDSSSKYASILYERDILKGEVVNGARYFRPSRSISRAELGAVVARVLNYSDSNGQVLPGDQVEDSFYIKLNGKTISIGDTQVYVEQILGSPNRIDPSLSKHSWHVYNSDYSNFIMVGIREGTVEALYTNSKGFEVNGISYNDDVLDQNGLLKKSTQDKIEKNNNQNVRLFTDEHNENKVYACLISSDQVLSTYRNESFFKAQELQIFDMTNAYRTNYGLDILKNDGVATITARNHSQDMADKNYFSHTNLEGLSPWDRYKNNQGSNSGSGENIAAGNIMALDSFNQWVNSKGHRNNMLSSNHKYLGVGYGHNSSSRYRSYVTQLFTR